MKKFFGILLAAVSALVLLPGCGGGGDTNGDKDGDGAVSAQEFYDGAGLEFAHNPIFQIERGRVASATSSTPPTPENPNFAKCTKTLSVASNMNNFIRVTDVDMQYQYSPDNKTAEITITMAQGDLTNKALATLLGRTEANVNFTGGSITIKITYNGVTNPAEISVNAEGENVGDDDDDDDDGGPTTVTQENIITTIL